MQVQLRCRSSTRNRNNCYVHFCRLDLYVAFLLLESIHCAQIEFSWIHFVLKRKELNFAYRVLWPNALERDAIWILYYQYPQLLSRSCHGRHKLVLNRHLLQCAWFHAFSDSQLLIALQCMLHSRLRHSPI